MCDYFIKNILLPDNHRHHITFDVQVGFQKTENLYICHTVIALLDTGATCSCVSKQLANELELQPIKDVIIISATGEATVPQYTGIDLILKNKDGAEKTYNNLEVYEYCRGQNEYDFIIGMDILNTGDMVISNANGKTMFSFRSPPSQNNLLFRTVDGKIHEYDSSSNEYTGCTSAG